MGIAFPLLPEKIGDPLDNRSGGDNAAMPQTVRPVQFHVGACGRIAARMIGRNFLILLGMDDQDRLADRRENACCIKSVDAPSGEPLHHALESRLSLRLEPECPAETLEEPSHFARSAD